MLRSQINSKKQGDVGLGYAIAYFCSAGFNVCIPLTDSQDYDLIVEKDNVISRVQVKTVYFKSPHGTYVANLKICGGNRSRQTIKNFDGAKIEYLFILTEDGNKYLIPTSKDTPLTSIALGKDKDIYKVL